MPKLLAVAAVAALALASGAARAATELVFTITGSGEVITFDLPQDPTPDSSSPGASFSFDSVDGIFDGVPVVFTAGVSFWNPDQETGVLHLGYFPPYFGIDPSLILYTGSESSPTFKTGTFAIADGEVNYVLTIHAVPEISTWGLMLLGFAGLGFAGRRLATKAARAV